MLNHFNLKPVVAVLGLMTICSSAFAQLSADRTDINSSTGPATVTVSFPQAVSGDLYIAALAGSQFLFVTSTGFTTQVLPFKTNSTFSTPIQALQVNSAGIPAGTYSLFQVVVKAGADPLNVTNWIGGFAGLSELKFNINLTQTTTTVDTVALGKLLYLSSSFTCSDGGCHGTNPKNNKNSVMKGTTLAQIKSAIAKNPDDMGFLTTKADSDLKAIADYVKSLQ